MQKKKREKKHHPVLVSGFNYGFCQLDKRKSEKLEGKRVVENRPSRMGMGKTMMIETD